MTLQTLTTGKEEFIVIAQRDFQILAEQAQRQTEDDYWIRSALEAEATARAKKQKPMPFDEIEREIDDRNVSVCWSFESATALRPIGDGKADRWRGVHQQRAWRF